MEIDQLASKEELTHRASQYEVNTKAAATD